MGRKWKPSELEYFKRYWAAHPEKRRAIERRYYILHKAQHIRAVRKWEEKHPEKVRLSSRKYRRKHPECARKAVRKWRINNPEAAKQHWRNRAARLRGAGGVCRPAEWAALLKYYGNRCLACGLGEIQLKCLRRKLVPDHVRPIARGGRNDISNLQPLCHGRSGCNNSKGTSTIDFRK